jgi:hypothetical protein
MMNPKMQSALSASLLTGLLMLAACAQSGSPVKAAAIAPRLNAANTASTSKTGSSTSVQASTDQNGRITESTDRDLNDPTGYVYNCQGTVFNQENGDKAQNSVQQVSLNVGDETIDFKKVIYQDTNHEILLENNKGNLSLFTLNGDLDHQQAYAGVTLGAKNVRMDGYGLDFESTITCRETATPKTASSVSYAPVTTSTNNSTTPTTNSASNSTTPATANTAVASTGDSVTPTNTAVATATGAAAASTSNQDDDDVTAKVKKPDPLAPVSQTYDCTGTMARIDGTDSTTNDLTVTLSSDDQKEERLFMNNTLYKAMIISNLGHIQVEVDRKTGSAKRMGTAKVDFSSPVLNLGIRNQEVDVKVECTR